MGFLDKKYEDRKVILKLYESTFFVKQKFVAITIFDIDSVLYLETKCFVVAASKDIINIIFDVDRLLLIDFLLGHLALNDLVCKSKDFICYNATNHSMLDASIVFNYLCTTKFPYHNKESIINIDDVRNCFPEYSVMELFS